MFVTLVREYGCEAMAENPDLKVYFARGSFRGLNGNYTSGVIEGAYYYGLFSGEF